MPVDRNNHRRGVVEDSEEGRGERGDETVGVLGSAVDDRPQVDAGREALACAGDVHRPVEVPHRRDDRVEQLDVEGVSRRGWSNRSVATPSTTSTSIIRPPLSRLAATYDDLSLPGRQHRSRHKSPGVLRPTKPRFSGGTPKGRVHNRTQAAAEYRFNTRITALDQSPDGVQATPQR